jgi:hypothetical protein
MDYETEVENVDHVLDATEAAEIGEDHDDLVALKIKRSDYRPR